MAGFAATLSKKGNINLVRYLSYDYDCGTDTGGTVSTSLDTILDVRVVHNTDESFTLSRTNATGNSSVTLGGMTNSSTGKLFIVGTGGI